MEELSKSTEQKIKNLIYEIRDQQVMLDSDLAKLYEVETRNLNKAVKRNIERFPNKFMFQLTEEEYKTLMFQFGTSNGRGGTRKRPFAFTESGVAMLSSVLHTERAVSASIQIIDAFVAMRRFIGGNLIEQQHINKLTLEDHERLSKNIKDVKLLQDSFKKFEEKRKDHEIFFNGQIFDAYSKIYEILKEAKENLIIIDNYADITLLNIIKKLHVKVVLIISAKAPLSKQDLETYNRQYNNLTVTKNNTFHDRYFVLDKQLVYHCGTSVNHIGNKTFSITRICDTEIVEALLRKINKL